MPDGLVICWTSVMVSVVLQAYTYVVQGAMQNMWLVFIDADSKFGRFLIKLLAL